ncbi:putative transcriptional regulator [Klebsiella grimontii]|uniref:Putative transcriptional regulator n=1 Tax=Klebsiella grimontii TaxID=2058152 RepID=A0A7H4P4P1_9ENTR|nr:putative transcriptional regulator [Klebsiella grimontii]
MLDYRFPTALQMVPQRSNGGAVGERSTSAILAYGLEANPSFIRKLMFLSPVTASSSLPLAATALFILAARRKRSPCAISTSPSSKIKKLWASRPDVPARCVVSANACWYFKSIADEAEQASLQVLARHTVASALEEVKKADTKRVRSGA